MDFKTKKIRKHRKEHKPPQIFLEKKHNKKITFALITTTIIIALVATGIVKAVSSISLSFVLKAAGDELQADTYGHTNFLLLGTGGENHEGGDLTDTIMIASLDQETNQVSMISIPRDYYVKDDVLIDSRINEVYLNAKTKFGSTSEGLEYAKNKIENIAGVPIHYWLKADFKGFKELVDAIGGIDVNVEEAIYDPYYPKDETFLYETFSISPGPQHLDGATALKYARSRKTTSDFSRAQRQQQIIYAIKEKALSSNIIFSKAKITNILDTLKANIETNITIKEILTLGSLAKDIDRNSISHFLIHDDPSQCGGFVYTPLRQNYYGMFVLIEAGSKYNYIHKYFDLHLNTPYLNQDTTRIQILNGTKRGGAAAETKQVLKRFCLDITRFGNGRNKEVTETTYYYKKKYDEDGEEIDSKPAILEFLQKIIPGKESNQLPTEYEELGYWADADLIIELGSDYTNSPNYLEDPYYYLPDAELYQSPTTETTTTTNEN
ncbi:hypothetical protein COU74_04865 [Candidatus Peregrinibacteria bacterium CG10_big_fil_rev_8_21_14_0_10_36_19]|nr:MAG: hypothetical protein COU74_04865 [Candidatus Peregrinibacteria bacterium CG10_big_fil_rev_8_21_14_0_10_36_19]